MVIEKLVLAAIAKHHGLVRYVRLAVCLLLQRVLQIPKHVDVCHHNHQKNHNANIKRQIANMVVCLIRSVANVMVATNFGEVCYAINVYDQLKDRVLTAVHQILIPVNAKTVPVHLGVNTVKNVCWKPKSATMVEKFVVPVVNVTNVMLHGQVHVAINVV